MEIIYRLVIILLLGVTVVLAVCLAGKRRQLRTFARTLQRKQQEENFTPLLVQSFSPDIVELANQMNETIARQHKLQLETEQAKEQLQKMVAGISHDFRTPLTAVLGYLQMMDQRGGLGWEEQEELHIVMERCQHLYRLADDFFEMSRLSAQRTDIRLEPVEINRLLVEECLLAHEWISARHIEAAFDLPDSPVLVLGEEHSLKRVFSNLFSNMNKYAHRQVRIRVEREEQQVLLAFSNDLEGDPISAGAEQVFEPFYRSPDRHGPGSGLGLYVVKCLVEQMQGTAEAFCEDGIFTIRLRFQRGLQ
jgi:signal transduction histidine kinase